MLEFFNADNITYIALGAWSIICPAYLTYKKFLGYKAPQVFKTTDFKRKFKKHQIQFNEEFKQSKLFK